MTAEPVPPGLPGNALLDRMRFAADPLADEVAAKITGHWEARPLPAGDPANAPPFERLARATRMLEGLPTNAGLAAWSPAPDPQFPDLAPLLSAYVAAAHQLPPWHNATKLMRAETLFYDYGLLSCTMQFCAALPECYVAPDLSTVLQITGQLVQRTDHRVRATAAMIFPVMLKGGLTHGDGCGVRQVLKVRLIHAVIRNLILHGDPAQAKEAVARTAQTDSDAGMYEALYSHGWNLAADGLPCNQEELAYILLTFGYVYLRSLRRLGIGLPSADEEAYLHCWNVTGHLLGVDTSLMAHTMDEAQALFTRMQQRARARSHLPDPRPALGRALVGDMAANIPLALFKPFGTLMTRYLCGAQTAIDIGIGINGPQPLSSRVVFAVMMGLARVTDSVARWFSPQFSIARFLTRLVGYPLMAHYLMDQTRPLKLPEALHGQMNAMLGQWSTDPHAPRWLNALERRCTGRSGPGRVNTTPAR
jgi:hypothetical protein